MLYNSSPVKLLTSYLSIVVSASSVNLRRGCLPPTRCARGSGNSVDCSPGLTPWAKSWRPWRDSEFTEPSIAGFNFARPRRISILRRSNFDCRRQISLPALKRAIQIVNSIVGRSKSRLQGTNDEVVFSCAQRAQGIWSPARDGSSVAQGVSPGYKNKNNQSPERPVRA